MSGKGGVSKVISEIDEDSNVDRAGRKERAGHGTREIRKDRLLYRAWEVPVRLEKRREGQQSEQEKARGKEKGRREGEREEREGERGRYEEGEEGPNIINPRNSKQIGLRQAGLPAIPGGPLRGHRYFVLAQQLALFGAASSFASQYQ
ncbi:uncharacterized protein MCYG_06826 [Microsporum canis CBS 113480]|uniref:Uncharacterized protein n=1 Tax=Arthroderma otae (strain ATCC MYA-4605 / CBS 113480) TaxID=554155 RepID=C5FVS3_ARTOC|nr:uncharacterized protein MCYG_06826 [Microsporum canis CBS 113480]EEQ34007.1 predicted protein [Microsporum canis CBS 113480]